MQKNVLLWSSTLARVKSTIRLIDDTYIPLASKMHMLENTLRSVTAMGATELHSLALRDEQSLSLLCEDITAKSGAFLKSPSSIESGRELCILILSLSSFFYDYERKPWELGRSVTRHEKSAIRSAIRKVLHNNGIRGERCRVEIRGSLARGYSDYKHIGEIPKPTDYDLPREYRKVLDAELGVHQKLKPKLSDVDIFIMNNSIYNSIAPTLRRTWVTLGEKYPQGLGGSLPLKYIHEKLSRLRIGGIRGRWPNFRVCANPAAYSLEMQERKRVLAAITQTLEHDIVMHDILVMDEAIS